MYSAKIDGQPTTFGTSGLLYRSNKLMYDRLTNTLWNQFTGEPVLGPLWNSGVRLELYPVLVTTWAEWVELHPDTTVLDNDTGLYSPSLYLPENHREAIYFDYFNSPDTMFPLAERDERLATKDVVLGVQVNGATKAYPIGALQEQRIVNDVVGGVPVVVVASAAGKGACAYFRGDRVFAMPTMEDESDAVVPAEVMDDEGAAWRVTEEALVNVADPPERFLRIPAHVAFWFGWFQFHPETELYDGP